MIIEWELCVLHAAEDVHNKLEACLLQVLFSFGIEIVDRLEEVPLEYLVVRFQKKISLIPVQ